MKNVFSVLSGIGLMGMLACGGSHSVSPAAPSFTVQPTAQTATVTHTATFTVGATGWPLPTYQWQRNGQNLPGATSSSYTTPSTTVADDGAQFAVTINNTLGSVTSTSATLTVTAPPVSTLPGPSMHFARMYQTATRLPDGRVAMIGGYDGRSSTEYCVAGCEIFDPATNRFTDAGTLKFPRFQHTATLLGDGRIVLIGGYVDGTDLPTAEIEVWDPAMASSASVGRLKVPRLEHSTTLLPDGKLLIVAGGYQFPNNAEILDPATWTSVLVPFAPGYSPNIYAWPSLCPLPSGDVVVEGGYNGVKAFPDRQIYRWRTSSFELMPPLARARWGAGAFLLQDGRMIIAGGGGDYGGSDPSSIEVYQSAEGPLLSVQSGGTGGAFAASTLLDGNRILLTGGHGGTPLAGAGLSVIKLYDPDWGGGLSCGTLLEGRWGHSATRLQDGRVLVAGGTPGVGIKESTEILESH